MTQNLVAPLRILNPKLTKTDVSQDSKSNLWWCRWKQVVTYLLDPSSGLIAPRQDRILSRPPDFQPRIVPLVSELPCGVVVGRLLVVKRRHVTKHQMTISKSGRNEHLAAILV